MTTIHELKEEILEMEKTAHEYELEAGEADNKDDAYFCENIAGMYRIAAAGRSSSAWKPGTAGSARRRESCRRMQER